MTSLRWCTHTLVAVVAALAAVSCGGTGGTGGTSSTGSSTASPSVASVAMTCQTTTPFAGAPMHAALPASAFPASAGAATPAIALPDTLTALLDQRLHEILQQTGAPALSAAIAIPGLGRWSSSQGMAQVVPPQTVDGSTEFIWGSVTKAFTAVLVLQLVQEGKLRLDDPVSRWYPQLPQAQRITIAHLLNHSSGLQTNTVDPLGLGTATPVQQLAALANMPLLFCPGTNASYSNAGYLVLGLVVEAIEQQPFYQSVQQRIALPLNLLHLRVLRPGEDMPATLAIPHDGRTPKVELGISTRLGVGDLVGRADDMVIAWEAVLSGKLLLPATVQAQWALLYSLDAPGAEAGQANRWFGKGVMLFEWTDELGHARTWLGHTGGIAHANALMAYDHTADAYTAVAVNSTVSSLAVANALLKVVMEWRATQ